MRDYGVVVNIVNKSACFKKGDKAEVKEIAQFTVNAKNKKDALEMGKTLMYEKVLDGLEKDGTKYIDGNTGLAIPNEKLAMQIAFNYKYEIFRFE